MSDHLLSHSNSFGFEMEIDTAGCRAYNRNYIVGEGKLWGAALDVTVPEPLPADSPLWDIPNLILTPHVAGGMRLEITRKNCIQMAQDNLRRYLAGEPLVNRVR